MAPSTVAHSTGFRLILTEACSRSGRRGRCFPPPSRPISRPPSRPILRHIGQVPAMYNIIEAVAQLRGTAGTRQIPRARCDCCRVCTQLFVTCCSGVRLSMATAVSSPAAQWLFWAGVTTARMCNGCKRCIACVLCGGCLSVMGCGGGG